jgi:hypothetical protein
MSKCSGKAEKFADTVKEKYFPEKTFPEKTSVFPVEDLTVSANFLVLTENDL